MEQRRREMNEEAGDLNYREQTVQSNGDYYRLLWNGDKIREKSQGRGRFEYSIF